MSGQWPDFYFTSGDFYSFIRNFHCGGIGKAWHFEMPWGRAWNLWKSPSGWGPAPGHIRTAVCLV
jgi:hypothetical protein